MDALRKVALFASVYVALICVLISGCSQVSGDPFDASASVVAGYIQDARAKCHAAGVSEIWECAQLGRQKKDAWLAALTALDAYETFKQGCYEAAGMTKCEAILERAVAKANAK